MNQYLGTEDKAKVGFFAALISQSVASFVVAPVEGIKIKLMADKNLKLSDICLAQAFKFKGMELFLIKEVVFSALYWPFVIAIKEKLQSNSLIT